MTSLSSEPGSRASNQEAALPALADTARGIVQVTSAERPLIAFGPQEPGATTEKKGTEKKVIEKGAVTAEAPPSSTGSGARWVIGAAGTSPRYGSRSMTSAPPQADAVADPAGGASAKPAAGTIR